MSWLCKNIPIEKDNVTTSNNNNNTNITNINKNNLKQDTDNSINSKISKPESLAPQP